MTFNLLYAAASAGVKKFFYASSACVYPELLQKGSQDVSLREVDVWASSPPTPQGLYGLEKLVSELLVQQSSSDLKIHIARFHNVYGPRGAWNGGREKAPAAMLRKAFSAKHLSQPIIEIWGDGLQRRSFLWIGDAVDAVLALLDSDFNEPVNIGSNESVSIQELAEIALDVVGLDSNSVQFEYDSTKPLGVGSRNSDNDLILQKLGWSPTTSLKNGMHQTYLWMEAEIQKLIHDPPHPEDISLLETFQHSKVIDLPSQIIKFAILLPITSRGLSSPDDCLSNLASFSRSLSETTWRDTHELGNTRYSFKVYLAIDFDDDFLKGKAGVLDNKALAVLREHNVADVTSLECTSPPGHVCTLWRHCAREAWKDGCDYFILLGDDVELEDEGWMRKVHQEFLKFERDSAPPGFGCVALTDTTFPGMPTFPVLHRTHMDIFNGEILPGAFVNQDGDPFLFQLYRRWGFSRMIECRIRNSQGGSAPARYQKQPLHDWTFEILDNATATVEEWLKRHYSPLERKLSIDVIIPCYRVELSSLDAVLRLRSSPTSTIMFIIIVDNPHSPSLPILQHKYGHRVDVRIRVNLRNAGASASRNRGMRESAADWVYFLDDDVHPQPDVILEAEKVIRTHPDAAGFIGYTYFPIAHNIFTTAVHLSGVTYFWDIARKMEESKDLPWGVSANLIARRVKDSVEFDTAFPKTGGGEDIDFVLKKREFSITSGRLGFHPAPDVTVMHPWWNNATRSYWRFYMWSEGDGQLVKGYPNNTYLDFPNGGEIFLIALLSMFFGVVLWIARGDAFLLRSGLHATMSSLLSNVAIDLYRHLWRDRVRAKAIHSNLSGIWWLLAIMESSLICMTSEIGRTIGILRRGEFGSVGRRFDWFVGRLNGPIYEERLKNLQRLVLVTVLFVAL
jgi:nucleoside-diphosphate-sugar epimerase/glycosyltransferase involved in cell wall biosynthesis